MSERARWHEDWSFRIRGKDVTVRVSTESPGRGELIAIHMVYGPSRSGLAIPVVSKQDAREKAEALLSEMMGSDWC